MKIENITKIYLPWLGEFGSEVLKYASIINADKDDKIVFHEEGKEAIYPNATKRIVIRKIPEDQRHCARSPLQDDIWEDIRNTYGAKFEYVIPTTTPTQPKMEFFHPQPLERYNIKADVVIFPRWRHTVTQMNWPYWKILVDILTHNGYSVFAAGAKDMSFDLNCPCAWDYDRELDASICAIENSKIRIGLMTALQVISLMCERSPWVILTPNGMQSPILSKTPSYRYLRQADHKKVGWKTFTHWGDPYEILMEVKRCLNTQS